MNLLLKLSIQKWQSKSVIWIRNKINKFWTKKIKCILNAYDRYLNSSFLYGDSFGFVFMHYLCLNFILAFIVSHKTSIVLDIGNIKRLVIS